GSTDELVSVLSAFFADGETVYTEIMGDEIKEYKTDREKLADFDKMVILCNEKTISSAETFIHCMKSRFGDKVTVIGQQTYGKNFSFNIYKFRDGDVLTFVTAHMGDYKGKTFSHEGITPDIVCEADDCEEIAKKELAE
ncbi:MAG: hypothetical protein K6F63_01375, partial [Lachnospiraceae bacterium]|nr:hypothetical protein [Lachnospiraceae bacterium]